MMQNLKKIFFLIILSGFSGLSAKDGVGSDVGLHTMINTMKATREIVKESLPIVEKTLNSSSKSFGNEAANALADGMIGAASKLAEGNVEAASKLGLESVQILAPIAAIGTGVFAVAQLWIIGKDIKNGIGSMRVWLYPTEEEKTEKRCRIEDNLARSQASQAQSELIIARREFKKCLVNNKKSAQCPFGWPCDCKTNAERLMVAAGNSNEVESLTQMYVKYLKQSE